MRHWQESKGSGRKIENHKKKKEGQTVKQKKKNVMDKYGGENRMRMREETEVYSEKMEEAGEWKLNRKSKTLSNKTDLIKKAEEKNGGEGEAEGEDVSGRIKISIKRTTGDREKQQMCNKVRTAERFCWQRSARRRWKTELFFSTCKQTHYLFRPRAIDLFCHRFFEFSEKYFY